ncbi:helix-turn-helix domain-containing protein [Luteipulveratus sp. YIM 133132]|uniref:Helix-turn-helix domain-containing protein n=1 Tax=Luteipulveratus flavus TaxID=3031728 RepID=A0ABT6C967_9MICO|nr:MULTISPECIES: helix-turn-helix domain-containing protein [unclassified Luteipulveratus]MDE9365871.1 helix-turn-helix domain-containing protein [Luteipulveratus sp. YIM 133132]MDF8265063.1 helix-turn-helix domain-containing protein [Luteipulveratus sp. YIM 133296]
MSPSEGTEDATPVARTVSSVVPDATALKALTHPVRLRMLGMLRLDGPATATQLADRLDLNSGATSYHLRQLAQHGFIEEDDARGSKRDRWWRARHQSTHFLKDDSTQEQREAGIAFAQAALTVQTANAQRAVQEYLELPPEWQETAGSSDQTLVLTAAQARALRDRLYDVVREVAEQTPALGGPRPEGTELYTVQVQAFPQPGRITHRDEEAQP